MELDDLKSALAKLDLKIEEQAAFTATLIGRGAHNRLEKRVAPLARAQTRQILIGLITTFLGVAAWYPARLELGGPFMSGVILHAYGTALIAFGAVTKALLGAVVWEESVLKIQQRLARVRRAQIVAGIVVGLSWCVLWVPAAIALAYILTGIDITEGARLVWWWLTLGGFALLGAIGLFHVWATTTARTAVTRAFDKAFTGEPLSRVLTELDEIRRFERD